MLNYKWQCDPSSKKTYPQQFADFIRSKIESHNIPQGFIFPQIHVLAKRFGISSRSISQAFHILSEEGYLDKQKKQITVKYVSRIGVNWGYFIKRAGHTLKKSDTGAFRYLTNIVGSEFGFVDIYREALVKASAGINEIEDGSGENGLPELIEQMSQHLDNLNIKAAPSQIFVVPSNKMAIYSIAVSLMRPGSTFLSVKSSRIDTGEAIAITGMQIQYLKYDEQGIIAKDLYAKIHRSNSPVLYIEPLCMWPLGITCTQERLFETARLCRHMQVPIIECDIAREQWLGEDIAPMKAYDADGNILYQSAFLSMLSPMDHVSYVAGPESTIKHMRNYYDSCSADSMLSQKVLLQLLKTGVYSDFITQYKKALKKRLTEMQLILQKYLNLHATWSAPAGDVCVIIYFFNKINFALLNKNLCTWLKNGPHSIRLLVTSCTLDNMEEFCREIVANIKNDKRG